MAPTVARLCLAMALTRCNFLADITRIAKGPAFRLGKSV